MRPKIRASKSTPGPRIWAPKGKGDPVPAAPAAMPERPRFHRLKESYGNQTRDVVDRLLMDNAADEVFVLQTVREHLDPEAYAAVRRALEQIATRSRHIGKHLCELADPK